MSLEGKAQLAVWNSFSPIEVNRTATSKDSHISVAEYLGFVGADHYAGGFTLANWPDSETVDPENGYFAVKVSIESGYLADITSVQFRGRSDTGLTMHLRGSLNGHTSDLDSPWSISDTESTHTFNLTSAYAGVGGEIVFRFYVTGDIPYPDDYLTGAETGPMISINGTTAVPEPAGVAWLCSFTLLSFGAWRRCHGHRDLGARS